MHEGHSHLDRGEGGEGMRARDANREQGVTWMRADQTPTPPIPSRMLGCVRSNQRPKASNWPLFYSWGLGPTLSLWQAQSITGDFAYLNLEWKFKEIQTNLSLKKEVGKTGLSNSPFCTCPCNDCHFSSLRQWAAVPELLGGPSPTH